MEPFEIDRAALLRDKEPLYPRVAIDLEENWVAVAEQMGDFELSHSFGTKRASLKFGKWGDLMLYVFGEGQTIDAATKACVLKARATLQAMGQHAPRRVP
jgi:hypothetical protein